eukprot:3060517-Pyramimonas_sp.AAC.1
MGAKGFLSSSWRMASLPRLCKAGPLPPTGPISLEGLLARAMGCGGRRPWNSLRGQGEARVVVTGRCHWASRWSLLKAVVGERVG